MQRSNNLSVSEKAELECFVAFMAPWEVFATHTFSRPRGLFEAGKIYEGFMDRVCPKVTHFYAVEKNPGGPGHHIHAMWADCEEVCRKAVWKQWFHQLGRNRIEPIRSSGGVRNYCVKYVLKEGALWWFRINNPQLHAKVALSHAKVAPI